jgi:hypothetical protein
MARFAASGRGIELPSSPERKQDIQISDGYSNTRVHKCSPGGRLIRSWGRSGVGKGAFDRPHICRDEDRWVDRSTTGTIARRSATAGQMRP